MKKAEKKAKERASAKPSSTKEISVKREESDHDDNVGLSDNEKPSKDKTSVTPATPLDQHLKRKRSSELTDDFHADYKEASPNKRARSITPPPPPATPLDQTLKRKRSEDVDEDASGMDDVKAIPNKRARSITPPPPPPPPLDDMPADSPADDPPAVKPFDSPYINGVFDRTEITGNGLGPHTANDPSNVSADPTLTATKPEPLKPFTDVVEDGIFSPEDLPEHADGVRSDDGEAGLGNLSPNRSRYAVAQSS